MRHKLNRRKLAQFIANLPQCLIGMEACPGSQHLARVIQRSGHDVRLIAPKFIKPYLKSQKNDFNDAEAIAEAVSRPTMRFVAVRSNEQIDLQAVHRIRERLIGERTAVINQIRAFLIEYGLPVKVGRAALGETYPTSWKMPRMDSHLGCASSPPRCASIGMHWRRKSLGTLTRSSSLPGAAMTADDW